MIVYILLPLILLFFLNVKGKAKIYVALFILFVINVCRDYTVGEDYGKNYKRIYDEINIESYKLNKTETSEITDLWSLDKKSTEIGWYLLQYFSKLNEMPFAFVNFLAAIIIFISLLYALKQSPNPIFTLLLYVLLFRYYASYNIIRQSIAAIIFLVGIPFIIKRKFVKYLFCVLIAMCFHMSSILMIVFYFLPNIKINYKFSILLIISFYIISALNIDTIIISWIYDSGYIFTSYARYLTIENDYNYNIVYLYIPSILLLIPYICLSTQGKGEILDVYQLLYVVAIILSILSIHYEVLFRTNEYFINSLILTIPILLRRRNLNLSGMIGCIIIGCCVLYYGVYLFLNANNIQPYSLIFFN